jgi:hypothetical protein
MENEVIQQAIGVGGGIIGGGSLVMWLAKRYISKVDELVKVVYTLAAGFDAWKSVNLENKNDIKLHEHRITIIEPAVARAHERLDELKRSLQ